MTKNMQSVSWSVSMPSIYDLGESRNKREVNQQNRNGIGDIRR